MFTFSTQRFSKIYRTAATFLSCCLMSGLFGLSAGAQSNDELYKGTWQIDTPDQGALIMLVKSQGLAAYFWGDNTDRTIYQGTWESAEGSATLVWSDGSRHLISRDSLGYGITYFDASGKERYTAQAQQVPSEVLGQWAKPPTVESEATSDRDKAKGFFGLWKVGQSDTDADYIFVESDRSAASTEAGQEGLRGSWAKQGSELHISWDSGHYSIIRENKRGFTYKRIEPGAMIEDDPSKLRPAVRTIEEKVPSAWLSNYRKERETHSGGIAFSSSKNARSFYRGDWIVQLSENRFERIEITRFGGLNTSAERGLEGQWRMQGQDIFMRWDNGMRKILSPVGRGFLLYEYKPGRPLDGVPTRIRAAAPADTAKLAEHMKGREDVAQQMIQLAEAAGIDPDQQADAGWGRTFARWAWPFGEDDNNATSEALLEEEYEPALETDPWWWPFWSEKTPAQENHADATTGIDEADALALTEEQAESVPLEVMEESTEEISAREAVEAPKAEKKRSSTRDWVWPF